MSKENSDTKISQIVSYAKNMGKSIVLVGGCFDILHIGHIRFLEEAKKFGDILVVLLESDKRVRKLKGNNRPFFNQKERSCVLSALSVVNYVISLPTTMTDKNYAALIVQLRPSIIAATANDPILACKKKQAEMIGGRVAIIPYVKTYSSSKLASIIGID